MNNIGSSQPSFANVHYFCFSCGRDLWDRHRRLRNPTRAPNVNKINGMVFCDKCTPSNNPCRGFDEGIADNKAQVTPTVKL
jgi:hypothetical protein